MKRILVVEDDPIVRRVYHETLTRAGFQVEVAVDGEEALAVLLVFEPEGVVLDYMLPKVNGLEVLKRIREYPEYKNVPVFILSNMCIPQLVDEAKAAGASGVLDKASFSPQYLVMALK